MAFDYQTGSAQVYELAAAANIEEGEAVGITTTGFARPLAVTDKFAGFAIRDMDNTGGANGALKVDVFNGGGKFVRKGLTVVGATRASIGSVVYMTNSTAYSTSAGTNNVKVGVIINFISSTNVTVEFKTFANAYV